MPFYLTPTTTALIIVSLLLIFACMPTAKIIRHRFFLRKRFVLLEIPTGSGMSLKPGDFLNLPPPFALEVAVHQLGKEIHYYLAVPRNLVPAIVKRLGAYEVQDYDVCHSRGSHLGFYLKGGPWPQLDLREVDFSRINEIGEGAVLQMIVVSKSGRKLANLRILISAPSPYQAQEIALGLNSSLIEFKPAVVAKNLPEFIHQVTFREFDEEGAAVWSNT